MINYGLEFEFFVTDGNGLVVPACIATNNLDGNPVLGELRTGVYSDLTDCVFELQKLIYNERKAIEKKGYRMFLVDKATLTNEQIKALRSNSQYVNQKHLRTLTEYSIYGRSTGKVLPKGVYKASLQINVSDNREITYRAARMVGQTLISESETKWVDQAFNYPSILWKWDVQFANEIKLAGRVPGVYAIKAGIKGNRIEYRSLPASVPFLYLLNK